MRRRKRLRKKLHHRYLTTVAGYLVGMDDGLRQRLVDSEPGPRVAIKSGFRPWIDRLLRRWGLRYWVAVAQKRAPRTAVVVFGAAGFPEVRDEAVMFDVSELGLTLPRT